MVHRRHFQHRSVEGGPAGWPIVAAIGIGMLAEVAAAALHYAIT